MNLLFKFNFWRLKQNYFDFKKIQEKYNFKKQEKSKFVKFFIKDEEDKILNKKVIDNFDKKIQKLKLKLYKKEIKIKKLLFSLGIVDLNYIEILYNNKISKKDLSIIKMVFKYINLS